MTSSRPAGDSLRRSLCLAAFALALAFADAALAAKLEVKLEGLSKPQAAAVRSRLEIARYTKRKVSAAQVRRLFRRAEGQIRTALEPYGYYNVEVDASLDEVGGGFRASFRVAPGEATTIGKLDIVLPDEALALRPVRRAVRRFSPQPGEPLDHAAYERSKANLQNALFADGYLEAEPIVHRVAVRRADHRADISLEWKTGERYRYGETTFTGSQFDPGFLDRYVPWKPGDYYDQDEILQMQQQLADADYFSLIEVAPAVERAADGVVPIAVTVAPAKRTVYTGGVFVGTDSGPGVRGALDRRWVNRRGHKLRLEAEISQRLNLLIALYRIPLPGPNERSYNFGSAYRDEDTETSESRTLRLTANETRRWHGWTRTIGLQYLTGTFTVADEDGDTTLLYPEATLTKKSVDSLDFVRRGWSLGLALRTGYEGFVSETSFAQMRADAKWIHAFGQRDRFIARGALGATWVENFDKLPPELRYFGGGDRTIRGYAFETIGPRNAAGKVIGGKHLAVLSAEYEHYFTSKWGGAVFVDAGDAFSGADFNTRVGAGVGLRWRSPVGMVRVDLGVPISDRYESGVQLHLVIGPDL